MTLGNGTVNGNGASTGQVRFTFSQLIQFLALVAAGMLAWGNLKGDVRELSAVIGGRLDDHEHRITSLEHHRRGDR